MTDVIYNRETLLPHKVSRIAMTPRSVRVSLLSYSYVWVSCVELNRLRLDYKYHRRHGASPESARVLAVVDREWHGTGRT